MFNFLQVSQDDHFKYICLDCYDKVINHYDFIQNILAHSKESETRTVPFFEANKNEKLEDVLISKLHSDVIYPCPNCNKDLIILINNPSDSSHTFQVTLALVNQIEQSQENSQISDDTEEFNVCTRKSRAQDKLYELSLNCDIINENTTNDNKCDIKRKHDSSQKIDVSYELKTGIKRKIQQSTSTKTFNPTKMQKLEAKLDTMEQNSNELDSDYSKLNVTDLITFQPDNDVECFNEEMKNEEESSTGDVMEKKYLDNNLGKSEIIQIKLNVKEQNDSNSNYDRSNITGLMTFQPENDNVEYITDDKEIDNITVITKMEEDCVNENDTNDINISKNNVKQECNLCGARYILQEKYEFHMERHKLNKIDKYVCTKCDKETKNENLLWDHYLHMHKTAIRYLCLKCKKVFMKKPYLIAHQKTCKLSGNETVLNIKTDVDNKLKIIKKLKQKCKVCRKLIKGVDPNAINDEVMCASCKIKGISQRQYYCAKCNKHFMRQERLEFHKMRHNENMDEFICSTCGKDFSGENSLYEHYLFVHKGFRPHICEICGKSFQLKVRLKEHHRKHTGEMPYQCEVCGLRCRTIHALKFHKKSHFSNRHICDICGKSFLKKQNWNEHLEKHWKKDKNISLPRIFTCPVCNDDLPTFRMLKNHMIGIHKLDRQDPLIINQKPLYECNECQEKFKHQMSLKSHKEKVHEGKIIPLIFQCDICKIVCKAKRLLIKHIQKEHNDNKCQQCGKKFTDKKDLDHHVSLHNSKKLLACKYSDKQRDARNLHHHKYMNVYQCRDCNESFANYASHLIHRKKMHKPENAIHPERKIKCNNTQQIRIHLDKHFSEKLSKLDSK